MGAARRSGVVVIGVALLEVVGACSVSDPPVPQLSGPPQPEQPQASGEQAEVDVAVGLDFEGSSQQIAVAGYRYTGSYPLNGNPELGNDIDYSGQSGVVVHHGASIAGFSISSDQGNSWVPYGKVFPPSFDQEIGDHMAFYWGDPSVSFGVNHRSAFAYAFLAASQQAWDGWMTAHPGSPGVTQWPPSTSPDVVDSVCVVQGGGAPFGTPVCVRPQGIGTGGTDQPNVVFGVDDAGNDRPFVAADDYTNYNLLLFEASGSALATMSVDSGMGGYDHSPRIRRDQKGSVWLAGTASGGSGGVRLCHVNPSGGPGQGGTCALTPNGEQIDITDQVDLFAILDGKTSSIGDVRASVGADFGVVHRNISGFNGSEFEFAYVSMPPIGTDTPLHVGVTSCILADGGALQCLDVPQWGTSTLPGQQFEPKIEVVDRTPAGSGQTIERRYVFYEIDGDGVPAGYATVFRATLHGSPFFGPAPTLTIDPLLGFGSAFQPFVTPEVCHATYTYYSPPVLYWGDFFAFRFAPAFGQYPDWDMALYSSDELRGCVSGGNTWQGNSLHVVALGWPGTVPQ